MGDVGFVVWDIFFVIECFVNFKDFGFLLLVYSFMLDCEGFVKLVE